MANSCDNEFMVISLLFFVWGGGMATVYIVLLYANITKNWNTPLSLQIDSDKPDLSQNPTKKAMLVYNKLF